MKALRIIGWTVFVSLTAGQALACSPAENERDQTEVLPDCSVKVEKKGEIGFEGLSAAEKIGGSFVLQSFFTGTACGYAKTALVVDCKHREVLGIGIGSWNFNGDQNDRLDGFVVRLKAHFERNPMTNLEEFAALAVDGLQTDPIVSTRGGVRLSIGDQRPRFTYNLNCGCTNLVEGA